MSTTYLCTTGTSIAQGTEALKKYHQLATSWDDDASDLEKDIRGRLEKFDFSLDADRSRSSAELNSLCRMGLCRDDRVILLVTDTAEGRVCAEALATILRQEFGLARDAVEVARIRGLQVRNADLLRREGLPALVEKALQVIQNPQLRHGGEIVLNPTGGFKGVLPFLTVLGMLFRLRTVYLFEFSDQVISLPPLPVSFDLGLFQRALPALDMLQRESVVSEGRYFAAIEGFQEEERDLFLSFTERAGDEVTLSTLALALLAADKGSAGPVLKVFRPVLKRLETASAMEAMEIQRCLIRVSHPLWRSMHGHRFSRTGLSVFGESDGPRVAGFFEGSVFCVTSLFLINRGEHRDYEKELAGKTFSDFPLDQFEEWTPKASLEETNRELAAAKDRLIEEQRRTIADLKRDLSKGKQGQARKPASHKAPAAKERIPFKRVADDRQRIKALEKEFGFGRDSGKESDKG